MPLIHFNHTYNLYRHFIPRFVKLTLFFPHLHLCFLPLPLLLNSFLFNSFNLISIICLIYILILVCKNNNFSLSFNVAISIAFHSYLLPITLNSLPQEIKAYLFCLLIFTNFKISFNQE